MSKKYTRTPDGMAKCNICGKEVKPLGFNSHYRSAHSNFKMLNGAWNKGLTKETDERVAKYSSSISETFKRKIEEGWQPYFSTDEFWTEEKRQEFSEMKKEFFHLNPEEHPNRKVAGNRSKMTYPEQIAFDWLKKRGFEALHNQRIEGFYPDFLIDKIIIEIDGEYWHNEEKDAKRDKILQNAGYVVHRIKASSKIEEELEKIFRDWVSG